MDTVCIRHAVAMYCLTCYINVLRPFVYDYYYYYDYSAGKTIIALQVYESSQ